MSDHSSDVAWREHVDSSREPGGEGRADGPSESTVAVAGPLSESSRLATRFAPIPDPAFVILFPDPGWRCDLEQEATTRVGRDPRYNDLVLVSPSVSGRHCEVVVDDDECSLVDVGSSNGTFVNGERIESPRLLKQGDLITIGRYVFMFVWYRFARPPQPEVLSFRDLKHLLIKLYPTTASVQRLLLTMNSREVALDPSDTTSERAWELLLARFRRKDPIGELGAVLRVAMREHPGNRELERIKSTLDNWRHARRIPGLQERINTDARNSARVVREILVTHLESENDNDSLSQMLDEVTEDARSPGGVHRHPASELPGIPRTGEADLPFDVPEDSLVAPPWASPTIPQDGHAMEVPELGDSKRDMPSGTSPTQPGESSRWTSQEPENASVPEESHGASVMSARSQADGIITSGPGAGGGRPDEGAPRDRPGPDDDGESPEAHGVFEARVEVVSEDAQGLPSIDELEDTPAPSGRGRESVEDLETFKSFGRSRLGRRAVVGAGVLFGGLAVAVALWGMRPDQPGHAPVHVADVAVDPVKAERPRPALSATSPAKPQGHAETTVGDGTAPSSGAAGNSEGASTGTLPEAPGTTSSTHEETGRTVASRPAESSVMRIPVRPQFQVINFLDDDGMPVYDAAYFAGTGAWAPETSQVFGKALSDCVWVDGRRKRLTRKGSRLFLYIECTASGKPVAGWVYHRAMKRR